MNLASWTSEVVIPVILIFVALFVAGDYYNFVSWRRKNKAKLNEAVSNLQYHPGNLELIYMKAVALMNSKLSCSDKRI